MGIRRLSERESNLRRYYWECFCDRVNDPMSFLPNVVARKGDLVTLSEDELNPLEDPEFFLDDVADAIINVVKGEEDEDVVIYRKGADLIIRMDQKYKPREALLLQVKTYAGHMTRQDPDSQSLSPAYSMVELVFWPDDTWASYVNLDENDPSAKEKRKELRKAMREKPPFNESARLFLMFRRYWSDHRRFLKLGVCHFRFCGKLYVKSKHASGQQRYCCEAHRKKAERDRANQAD